ncbi:FHA domain-containing protein [Mycobacterium vicinigordonae]|uniref:FHA domain-containing protein n=1 Tax=Mycobacterium vicinigordonae TaxID=1719132 RepID=A0A7D6E2S8_9MYCO|nr:FHA domain-containing protein [Mycobacterium vicinigordonae]QLL06022.1 FHA domain-containing protein [Mycobacterium vicinigordonae]
MPTLVVRLGDDEHVVDPTAGVAVIGRDASATIRLPDERISRWHVRLEPHHDGWHAIDTSTNGMYLDGVRRSSVQISAPTTLHLANAEGFPVTLTPGAAPDTSRDVTGVIDLPEADEDEWWEADVDPGVARAGQAVAARRSELDITQRGLAKDKIINAGTLIAFEKGRSWPRRGTLAKLEKALQWSPGTIARIRSGSAVIPIAGTVTAPTTAPSKLPGAGEESTEVLTDTVRAPLMAEAVELAMHTISTAISDLPDPSEPAFTPKVTKILADLRKLENVAATAARNAKGTPSVVLALSSVRRAYNDIMARAAKSPAATLGQRLYGARHRAELSLDEAAAAAGLPASFLADAEAERPIPEDVAAALNTLIGQLSIS